MMRDVTLYNIKKDDSEILGHINLKCQCRVELRLIGVKFTSYQSTSITTGTTCHIEISLRYSDLY